MEAQPVIVRPVKVGEDEILLCPYTRRKFQSYEKYLKFVNKDGFKKFIQKIGKEGDEITPLVVNQNVVKDESLDRHDLPKGQDWGEDLENFSDSDMEDEGVDNIPFTDVDQTISLFDNYQSKSIEANIAYMKKEFGFHIPNHQNLKDLQGLLTYLGAKLIEGNIPLYESGLDEEAKRFDSLKETQQDMITNKKCYMFYEGNEEEYSNYYGTADKPGGTVRPDEAQEMVIPKADGKVKVLGSRAYGPYFKTRRSHITPDKDPNQAKVANLREQRLAYKKMNNKENKSSNDAKFKKAMDREEQKLKTGQQANLTNKIPDKDSAYTRKFNY